jgi:hypothetical protein
MYEIKITAESIGELRGRIVALAAELSPSKPAPPRPVAVAPEPVVVAPEPVVVVPEPVAEEPVAAEEITYEQVRTAILQVSVGVGREAVGTILQHFGATRNAQEIDPSRYAEVLAMAKKTLEG